MLSVAVVVVLGSITSILDVTVVNVAIDTLAEQFRASLLATQRVAAGYTLGLAMARPPACRGMTNQMRRSPASSVWP